MIKANFHTHTTYCDGKNTPEEMVLAAIRLGMTALGFSSHSYSDSENYGLKPETIANYRSEILRLKEKYRDCIEILLGIEQDVTSDSLDFPYDFSIGSMHGVHKDGDVFSIDHCEEIFVQTVTQHYQGDYYAYAEDYYRQLADSVLKHDPTFIGHFDLVTKFNEGEKFFDESHPRYQEAALNALEVIARAGKPFEINTGAVFRGCRTMPYPAPFLLKSLHEMDGKIILSSDAHSCDGLLFGYEKATELAKSCGFATAVVLTPDGFREESL